MKSFGRAFELNCLFLVVVALLLALQLVLQRSHHKEILLQLKERGDEGGGEGNPHQDALPIPAPLHHLPSQVFPPADDAKGFLEEGVVGVVDGVAGGVEAAAAGGGNSAAGGGEGNIAAPIVPNIRRSFPKRKAPYVRKAKKNKKKKKNRKFKQQQMRDGGGGGGGGGGGKGVVWAGKGDNGGNDKAQNKGNKQKKGRMNDKMKV